MLPKKILLSTLLISSITHSIPVSAGSWSDKFSEAKKLTSYAIDCLLAIGENPLKELVAKEYYFFVGENIDKMPNCLKEHFNGVSVQDLINHKAIPAITENKLNLEDKNLNSLDGLLSIPGIENIYTLSLEINQLQTLPDTIGNLQKLECLSLSNNQLQALPNTIGNLKWLRWLYLNNNQLQGLPDAIGKLKIRYLWVDKNIADTNPELICNWWLPS